MGNTILIVDDTEMNRSLLADMLSSSYGIIEAQNGLEAIAILQRENEKISLVLLDIVMPEMDGFEVLAVMNKNGWLDKIPVITISSETSSSYIDHAYDLGATDYINRPFDEKTVVRRVQNTLMLYSKQKMLERMVTEQILEKEKNNYLMVEILGNIVEFRNGESGMHVLHIRVLTDIFLRKLQELTDKYVISASRIALIVNASALHDIGKISILEGILNKPGKLTPEEFEIMKTHSAIGAQIMEDALLRHNEELLQIAYSICRWHHERYDGKGYPDGLCGDEIPIEAQVVALADVYDALTSVRVYKPAYPHEESVKMILDGECGSFNPVLLECLRQVAPFLKEELRIRSLEGVSEDEVRSLSSIMIFNGNISNRTLNLLEQERTKYQFFASMSNEIQFEYNCKADLLSISEWGAKLLGLPVLIEHPLQHKPLQGVLSANDYSMMRDSLRAAKPANPIVNGTYLLNVKGKKRWYKAVARPLWLSEETCEYIGAIGKFVDIHDEQLQMSRLKQLATQDSLTHLNNHTSAKEQIQKALASQGKNFALVLFDVDDFKRANDWYGHIFGDKILRHVAHIMQQCVKKGDILARVGGDEFMLFINYDGDVEPIIDRIHHALCCKYGDFTIAVSMGVARFPKNGDTYMALFHAADQALYAAKNSGKKQYRFYDNSMKEFLSVLSPMDH